MGLLHFTQGCSTQKAPAWGLMICGHCLEIHNNFIFEYMLGLPWPHLFLSPHILEERFLTLGPPSPQVTWLPPPCPCSRASSLGHPSLALWGPVLRHWEGGPGSDMGTLPHLGMGHGCGHPFPGLQVFNQWLGVGSNSLTSFYPRVYPHLEVAAIWWSLIEIVWEGRWAALGKGDWLCFHPTQHISPAAVWRRNPAPSVLGSQRRTRHRDPMGVYTGPVSPMVPSGTIY